jgi:predicted HicB family RNase H-like nuclease
VARRIACTDASLCEAFSCPWTPLSTFYKLLEIERVEFIRSLISYEGTDVESLRTAFEEAIDDYLALCKKEGREPEQPFSGSFNVRTGTELHRQAVFLAKERGTSLNRVVSEALERYLHEERPAL